MLLTSQNTMFYDLFYFEYLYCMVNVHFDGFGLPVPEW